MVVVTPSWRGARFVKTSPCSALSGFEKVTVSPQLTATLAGNGPFDPSVTVNPAPSASPAPASATSSNAMHAVLTLRSPLTQPSPG